jgi:hypothetical protein
MLSVQYAKHKLKLSGRPDLGSCAAYCQKLNSNFGKPLEINQKKHNGMSINQDSFRDKEDGSFEKVFKLEL